jgi:hypothetical protein
VEDAVLVGEVHGPGHGRDQAGRGLLIPGEARQVLGQAAALHQLHREIVLAVVLTHLVDRDDVGVVQVGGRLGFPVEAFHLAG